MKNLPPCITLTTDFGTRDGFTGQMKGVILRINPNVGIIDITHEIEPFAVLEGALVLKGVVDYFPSGTIHVAVVDPGVGTSRRAICVRAAAQYFVGPDNGLFSFIFQSNEEIEIRNIENLQLTLPDPHPTFHGRDIFAPIAAHLSKGVPFTEIGVKIDDAIVLEMPRPKQLAECLEGEIIYIDRFGNLSSNIDKKMLVRPVENVSIGKYELKGISKYFGEVGVGRPLALINSFGLLEIAVNRGNASKILGLSIGDRLKVAFRER